MRGCLGFLVFAAILVTLLAVAAVQLLLPAVVTAAVQGSPLVRGQPVAVTVDTSVTGVLLQGRIDRVRITGTDLHEPNATIGSLDVTLSDIAIADRTFASASGSLTGVSVTTSSGSSIPLDAVSLSGSSSTLIADVRLGAPAAEAAMGARLASAGVVTGSVTLVPGGVRLTLAGQPVQAQLVSNGTRLSLEIGGPIAPVEILAAPASGEWRIDAVDVTSAGVRLLLSIQVG